MKQHLGDPMSVPSDTQPSHLPSSHLPELAISYTTHGWAVFPLRSGGKIPAIPAAHPKGDPLHGRCQGGCGRYGHGLYDATRDPLVISRWWRYCPTANIGIPCGTSGLVVIDLDTGKGTPPEKVLYDQADDEPTPTGMLTGADVLAWLCKRRGCPWPVTYTVATPSGGQHLYFQLPTGVELRNTVGGRGQGIGWCIDSRVAGGYVVAAGSRRPEGLYTVSLDAPVAELPDWLYDALSRPSERPTKGRAGDGGASVIQRAKNRPGANRARRWAVAALERECQHLASLQADSGQGANHALNRAAFKLGQLIAANLLGEDDVRQALADAGHATGLTEYETERTLDSGLTAGLQTPRQVAS